jgi:signal transduction histidine kinase
VDDLLDASRLRQPLALELEELELGALAESVAARFRDRAVVRVSSPGSVIGHWDPPRVTRILESLLSNAVKFGAGLPVDVEVSEGTGFARVDVRDRGDGIPASEVERIFGGFQRAADLRHHGGLGLGLWIARLCAEAHGGTLSVTSRPHEGSCFTLALPAGVPDPDEARPPEASPEALSAEPLA